MAAEKPLGSRAEGKPGPGGAPGSGSEKVAGPRPGYRLWAGAWAWRSSGSGPGPGGAPGVGPGLATRAGPTEPPSPAHQRPSTHNRTPTRGLGVGGMVFLALQVLLIRAKLEMASQRQNYRLRWGML